MKSVVSNIGRFFRRNPVLSVAAVAALVSAFAVPPSAAYADYLNWRVLGLLFCLMACVSGLTEEGVFSRIGRLILRSKLSVRLVSLALVWLCFFVSMFVTNDVALITFVPFAILVFGMAGRRDALPVVVVLQTIAANLGSMVTPMGNPQNLFLYETYGMGVSDLVGCVAPFAVLSFVALSVLAIVLVPRKGDAKKPESPGENKALAAVDEAADGSSRPEGAEGLTPSRRGLEEVREESSSVLEAEGAADQMAAPSSLRPLRVGVFAVLFVLSVLVVLDILPLLAVLAVVIIGAAVANPKALAKVDYGLLLTFVCFFVFSGNLANIVVVRDALTGLMDAAPFAASLIASQVISNVPAAVLLAPFTTAWQPLLLGVDLGGLGTPIASLASLISLEYYRRAHVGKLSRYLAIFTILNVAFLAANILFGVLIGLI